MYDKILDTMLYLSELPGQSYLIVEGFLLLYHKPIVKLADRIIFLTLDENTCYKRRMSTKHVHTDYWKYTVWPNYIKYVEYVNKNFKGDNRLMAIDVSAYLLTTLVNNIVSTIESIRIKN
jgi:uridine kinase